MPAACDGRRAELVDDPLQGVDDRADRGVADDVEAGRDSRLGAGVQVRVDGVGVEIGVAAAVRCVGVRLVQPGGARPSAPSTNRSPASPRAPVVVDQGRGLRRRW